MSRYKVTETKQYDVVIVGAGLAGCTAARLYAKNGLRVALLEQKKQVDAYKKSCTHYIQASAVPTMKRLGLATLIEDAGGIRNSIDTWTQWGWVRHETDTRYPKHGYTLRREVLDPLLRKLTLETKGVDLFLGHSVKALQQNQDQITGVIAQYDKQNIQFDAQLVVAADGSSSTVAKLAEVPTKVVENSRFLYWAYYKNIPGLNSKKTAQMWLTEPDVAYHFPSDDGISLLAAIITKDKLAAFKQDRLKNFETFIAQMPEAPNFALGERISDLSGILNYANYEREPWMPGLALIGDSAVTGDPIWGIGCGWAFQSAEWLVDCTSDALLANDDLQQSLKQYKHEHGFIRKHNTIIADYSSGRPLNRLETLYFRAGVFNQPMARLIHNLASRHINPAELLYPTNLARALWVIFKNRKSPASKHNLSFQPTIIPK